MAVGADEADTDQSDFSIGVSCQLASGGRTIQLASNGLGIDDTVDLVHEVADRI